MRVINSKAYPLSIEVEKRPLVKATPKTLSLLQVLFCGRVMLNSEDCVGNIVYVHLKMFTVLLDSELSFKSKIEIGDKLKAVEKLNVFIIQSMFVNL